VGVYDVEGPRPRRPRGRRTAPSGQGVTMEPQVPFGDETFNPWSVVNLVFHHLAAEGLHPTLGGNGDPGEPAALLLRALGITPAAEGDRQRSENVRAHLETLREAVFHATGPASRDGDDRH
jgi:hypothetical protein